MKPCWRYIATIFCLALLAACEPHTYEAIAEGDKHLSDSELAELSSTSSPALQVFYFGFDLRASPQEDAHQYIPFLEYLGQATGYQFKLRFTPQNDDIIHQLGSNQVQFAAIGAVSFLKAAQQYPVTPLVRGINHQGRAEYRSYIVVRPNSKINSVYDLTQKKFAFGSTTSTQGHLIPRIMLSQHGIKLGDLSYYEYTGSHQQCADAVISRRFDA